MKLLVPPSPSPDAAVDAGLRALFCDASKVIIAWSWVYVLDGDEESHWEVPKAAREWDGSRQLSVKLTPARSARRDF